MFYVNDKTAFEFSKSKVSSSFEFAGPETVGEFCFACRSFSTLNHAPQKGPSEEIDKN
jgi:hypothetical protein